MFHQKYTLSLDLFVFLKTLNVEIIHIAIFHERNSFCLKYIGDILPYMRLIPKKVTQLKGRYSQYFIRLQERMHSEGEGSHALFSKLKQF